MKPRQAIVIYDLLEHKILDVFTSKREAQPTYKEYVDKKVEEYKKNKSQFSDNFLRKSTPYEIITLKEAIERIEEHFEDLYSEEKPFNPL